MGICDPLPNENACWNTRIIEALNSRSFNQTKTGDIYELRLFVKGTNDECTVRNRIEPFTSKGVVNRKGLPPTFPSRISGNANTAKYAGLAYPLMRIDVENIGWELWEVIAQYGWDGATEKRVVKSETLPTQISMSTRGGNATLVQSNRTMFSFPRQHQDIPATATIAPEFNGAIGWTGDEIKGVTVPSPVTRYSETWIFSNQTIYANKITTTEFSKDGRTIDEEPTEWNSYFSLWQAYTNRVHGPTVYEAESGGTDYETWNNTPESQKGGFREWDAGQVRLDNVNVRQVGLNYFEVTFEFTIRNNYRVIQNYEGYPDIADKQFVYAWDYQWQFYQTDSKTVKDSQDDDAWEVTAPRPLFTYIERIYDFADFTNLGLGTASLKLYAAMYDCTSKDPSTWNNFCITTN